MNKSKSNKKGSKIFVKVTYKCGSVYIMECYDYGKQQNGYTFHCGGHITFIPYSKIEKIEEI